jgi:hypothetical protein
MSATVPCLIGGRLESSASDRRGDVFNPSTGRVQAQVRRLRARQRSAGRGGGVSVRGASVEDIVATTAVVLAQCTGAGSD